MKIKQGDKFVDVGNKKEELKAKLKDEKLTLKELSEIVLELVEKLN